MCMQVHCSITCNNMFMLKVNILSMLLCTCIDIIKFVA